MCMELTVHSISICFNTYSNFDKIYLWSNLQTGTRFQFTFLPHVRQCSAFINVLQWKWFALLKLVSVPMLLNLKWKLRLTEINRLQSTWVGLRFQLLSRFTQVNTREKKYNVATHSRNSMNALELVEDLIVLNWFLGWKMIFFSPYFELCKMGHMRMIWKFYLWCTIYDDDRINLIFPQSFPHGIRILPQKREKARHTHTPIYMLFIIHNHCTHWKLVWKVEIEVEML